MRKSLKIKLNKNIGTIVLIVEGSVDEFRVLDFVFCNVLHYSVISYSRGDKEPKEYNCYQSKKNTNSKIVVFNTANSNIGSIEDENFYNEVYILLYEKYGLDIKNCPTYYLWDRDPFSNKAVLVKKLLLIYDKSIDNSIDTNGVLLLSYQCFESYLISCFDKKIRYIKCHPKEYVKSNKINYKELDRYKLLNSACCLLDELEENDIVFDVGDIKNTNVKVFDFEEKEYKTKKYYMLISMISYIFFDVGIIQEVD